MTLYSNLDKADVESVTNWFTSFLANPNPLASLSPTSKLNLVNSLLEDLAENGAQKEWNEKARLLALQTLKTLGRDPIGCDLLFSDSGFHTLMAHAHILQNSERLVDTPVSQEALICIANSLLIKEDTRGLFEKHKGVSSSTCRLRQEVLSINSQFLFSRILFLMTVKPCISVKRLIDELDIIDLLTKTISTHVNELSSPDSNRESTAPFTRESVLNEQLKLLFNLMLNEPKLDRDGDGEKSKEPVTTSKFIKLLYPITQILIKIAPPSPLPLAPPYSHAIHALLNFPIEQYKSIWFPPEPENEQYALIEILLDILQTMIFIAIKGDPDSNTDRQSNYGVDFDEVITPLVALLKKLSEEDQTTKTKIKNKLLPDDIDRSKPLEKGETLSARLIRLMTSVMFPNLRDNVSELLFTICDEDAHLFIHHVGYGNAAGFLMKRNILIPPTSSSNLSSKTGEAINPITGQYYQENPPSLTDMTDEEKEREAERLFVLFERLKKTGVMSVVNPVEQAINSGKFEEINDDDNVS
ncbi:9676_t:CDS:2 [Ambispora gerdemannii]|uniref:9676_t:CDS:1 n=1 Tax=Ambispora gerdemannii TaxID=144530 RepID=A0A9N9FZ74_9GLOM|nr:9676_t:CDS:2 [Ambispora gerdemannii]